MGLIGDVFDIVVGTAKDIIQQPFDIVEEGLDVLGGLLGGGGTTQTQTQQTTIQQTTAPAAPVGAAGPLGMIGQGGVAGQATVIGVPLQPIAGIAALHGITANPNGTPVLFTVVFSLRENSLGIRSLERGTPILMSRDMQRLKRTLKVIRKAAAKVPRKTVTESTATQTKNAIEQEVLRRITGPSCPPKCP